MKQRTEDNCMSQSELSAAISIQETANARSKAPVFVLGSPRSGTTLLYHMLLSAGNFAIYRAESEVFHLLEPRFGNLADPQNKDLLMQAWSKTRLFSATGLELAPLKQRLGSECRNGGDFLRIVMEETARLQGVARWAECTPDHILYIARIKQTIPNALIIHIIRDGRDVALSMERQGYPRRLPWDRRPRRMAAGLYWEWVVGRGRRHGQWLGADYIEVRYEDLVKNPQEVLDRLSPFIGQPLDYEHIRQVGIGSVSQPNTSFQCDDEEFRPVERWKTHYSPQEIETFEDLAGAGLRAFGYSLKARDEKIPSASHRILRAQYRAFFSGKFYLKNNTPLGRLLTRDPEGI